MGDEGFQFLQQTFHLDPKTDQFVGKKTKDNKQKMLFLKNSKKTNTSSKELNVHEQIWIFFSN